MRKCSLDALDSLFAAMSDAYSVYLPVDGDGHDKHASYKKWSEGVKYSNALNTVRSAKDFFFPQSENLMDFKIDGKNIEIIDTREESEDFIVFGVRACDAKSFEVLDNVFLLPPVDTYYKSRREHGVIMSMACTRPAETCFCQAFGIDAADPAGDVQCHIEDNEIYFDAKTEKGEKALETIISLTEECGTEKVDAQKEVTRERMKKLPLANLSTEKFGGDKTDTYFNSEKWKELSQSCIGCGTCTFVCPTCQCYDIKEFDTGHGVKRFRCWDSCMYSDFTKMSAGQPRLTQLERFRQRFMHKLVYYPANNDGLFSCVGCGRCVASCPISMNIVKVMKALGEEEDK